MRVISTVRSGLSTSADGTEPSTSRRLAFRMRSSLSSAASSVGDAPARKGVDDQPALVERRHFQRLGVERQDAPLIVDHVLDQRQLEADAGLGLDLLDLAELQDQRLLALVDDEDRRQGDDQQNDDDADDDGQTPHHWASVESGRSVRRSSFSGR
jgi:hypothetical protein